MAKYITIDSQGYLTAILNLGDQVDAAQLLTPQDGHQILQVTESFSTAQPRPARGVDIDLRYHVDRARWEDALTGQQYPQPNFTISRL